MKDPKKRNFLQHFVIVEGIKIIQSKIYLEENSIIPAFDPKKNNCNDAEFNKKPTLEITSNFHKSITETDFLLYVGAVNEPKQKWIAYASYCILGGKKSNQQTRRPKDRLWGS